MTDFFKRLKFFGFGFVIGMIILMVILSKRGCRSVNHMKVDELISQHTEWTPIAKCKREALGMKEDTMYYKVMSRYRVNYSKSDVRAQPCGYYRLEPVNRDSAKFEITIYDCDTISKIIDIDIFSQYKTGCDSLK
jgi:hypothetical protein